MKNHKALMTAMLVFAGCLWMGVSIARHKPLWTDEFYSQVYSVNNTSLTDQFLGKIPEGGNAPLFYSIQKIFLKAIRYQTPNNWLQGHWSNDALSQVLLRINPIIFMSLSVSVIFFYFCSQRSLVMGLYSVFIYLSSYMLWGYWAEARPYALLVFLTTVQSVILLYKIDQNPRRQDRSWQLLAITNILLSLTSILSLGEIVSVSVLWWIFHERDWKKYVVMTVIPAMIAIFYYVHAPKYSFYFNLSPEQMIRDNISRERFDLLVIFLVFLPIYWMRKRNVRQKMNGEILKVISYIIFFALVMAASFAVICLFALHATPGHGFPIPSRYFIYLMPIGVIVTTVLTEALIKSLSKYRLLQYVLIALIMLLLGQHFLKTVPKAIHSTMLG